VFETMLVQLLNRRRRKSRTAPPSGFYLGSAETLIGSHTARFSIPVQQTQHSFVSGRTGSGKTTLLMRLMAEHIRAGVPFLFIDFHGRATNELLALFAQAGATQRVLLLEPWADPVLGWNVLDTNGEPAYAVVQELVSVFHHRLWPEAWGPRMEELLRMTFLALAQAGLTLLEATMFLSRPEYRRTVLRKVSIAEVREFWTIRFESLSPSQRSTVTEPVQNKLSVFHDPAIKYVIGQTNGSLDLDRALASGQTLVANLSGGQMRGNNFLLAALLVAKFKSAVYRRPIHGKPYAIFLDEFQEMVAVDALDDCLRSFRKFNCAVYLATQHLQLPPELKAAIFGNCSRFFSFAVSASDAAFLGKEFGGAEGALLTEMLPELACGQAVAKLRGEPARLLRVARPEVRVTGELVAAGRRNCLASGMTRQEIDRAIEQRRGRIATARNPESASNQVSNANQLPEGYGDF
jgi:hypothetical protein